MIAWYCTDMINCINNELLLRLSNKGKFVVSKSVKSLKFLATKSIKYVSNNCRRIE